MLQNATLNAVENYFNCLSYSTINSFANHSMVNCMLEQNVALLALENYFNCLSYLSIISFENHDSKVNCTLDHLADFKEAYCCRNEILFELLDHEC